MELKQIDARIRGIKTSVTKLASNVQEVAVAIIEHAAGPGNGDVTLAIQLVRAIGTGANQRKLIFWFGYFANIGMDVANNKVRRLKEGSQNYRDCGNGGYDIEGAKANPWNTFEDPRQPPEQLPNTLGVFIAENIKIFDRLAKQVVDDKRFVNDPRQREEALAACREAKAVFLKHLPNEAKGGSTDAENAAAQEKRDEHGTRRRGRQKQAA